MSHFTWRCLIEPLYVSDFPIRIRYPKKSKQQENQSQTSSQFNENQNIKGNFVFGETQIGFGYDNNVQNDLNDEKGDNINERVNESQYDNVDDHESEENEDEQQIREIKKKYKVGERNIDDEDEEEELTFTNMKLQSRYERRLLKRNQRKEKYLKSEQEGLLQLEEESDDDEDDDEQDDKMDNDIKEDIINDQTINKSNETGIALRTRSGQKKMKEIKKKQERKLLKQQLQQSGGDGIIRKRGVIISVLGLQVRMEYEKEKEKDKEKDKDKSDMIDKTVDGEHLIQKETTQVVSKKERNSWNALPDYSIIQQIPLINSSQQSSSQSSSSSSIQSSDPYFHPSRFLFFQNADSSLPQYSGYFSKLSFFVSGKQPLNDEEGAIDYDADSEDEDEEEEETFGLKEMLKDEEQQRRIEEMREREKKREEQQIEQKKQGKKAKKKQNIGNKIDGKEKTKENDSTLNVQQKVNEKDKQESEQDSEDNEEEEELGHDIDDDDEKDKKADEEEEEEDEEEAEEEIVIESEIQRKNKNIIKDNNNLMKKINDKMKPKDKKREKDRQQEKEKEKTRGEGWMFSALRELLNGTDSSNTKQPNSSFSLQQQKPRNASSAFQYNQAVLEKEGGLQALRLIRGEASLGSCLSGRWGFESSSSQEQSLSYQQQYNGDSIQPSEIEYIGCLFLCRLKGGAETQLKFLGVCQRFDKEKKQLRIVRRRKVAVNQTSEKERNLSLENQEVDKQQQQDQQQYMLESDIYEIKIESEEACDVISMTQQLMKYAILPIPEAERRRRKRAAIMAASASLDGSVLNVEEQIRLQHKQRKERKKRLKMMYQQQKRLVSFHLRMFGTSGVSQEALVVKETINELKRIENEMKLEKIRAKEERRMENIKEKERIHSMQKDEKSLKSSGINIQYDLDVESSSSDDSDTLAKSKNEKENIINDAERIEDEELQDLLHIFENQFKSQEQNNSLRSDQTNEKENEIQTQTEDQLIEQNNQFDITQIIQRRNDRDKNLHEENRKLQKEGFIQILSPVMSVPMVVHLTHTSGPDGGDKRIYPSIRTRVKIKDQSQQQTNISLQSSSTTTTESSSTTQNDQFPQFIRLPISYDLPRVYKCSIKGDKLREFFLECLPGSSDLDEAAAKFEFKNPEYHRRLNMIYLQRIRNEIAIREKKGKKKWILKDGVKEALENDMNKGKQNIEKELNEEEKQGMEKDLDLSNNILEKDDNQTQSTIQTEITTSSTQQSSSQLNQTSTPLFDLKSSFVYGFFQMNEYEPFPLPDDISEKITKAEQEAEDKEKEKEEKEEKAMSLWFGEHGTGEVQTGNVLRKGDKTYLVPLTELNYKQLNRLRVQSIQLLHAIDTSSALRGDRISSGFGNLNLDQNIISQRNSLSETKENLLIKETDQEQQINNQQYESTQSNNNSFPYWFPNRYYPLGPPAPFNIPGLSEKLKIYQIEEQKTSNIDTIDLTRSPIRRIGKLKSPEKTQQQNKRDQTTGKKRGRKAKVQKIESEMIKDDEIEIVDDNQHNDQNDQNQVNQIVIRNETEIDLEQSDSSEIPGEINLESDDEFLIN
ncbi:MAG: hypothetical protein EZS28_010252 [Streblomastix strix]|uniref:Chromatin assembly factor 1 subunit A dimerization domain-containing protein n=1 Tax=Streblomastix strix TaxID=222440 RepID=A0A5J4WGS4_9EUKA|nr:MAG: hypothetical protein EZS28_010252 [Streblomastix strix]